MFGNLVAGSRTLRAAAALTIIAVLSVVWVVHRTIQRSQASNERVAHTQEVLTAIESVLATIVDADTAVHRSVPLVRDRTALGQTERAVERDIGRLATLTLDSPNQQARVAQLRQGAAAVLAALRTVVETTQGLVPSFQRMPTRRPCRSHLYCELFPRRSEFTSSRRGQARAP